MLYLFHLQHLKRQWKLQWVLRKLSIEPIINLLTERGPMKIINLSYVFFKISLVTLAITNSFLLQNIASTHQPKWKHLFSDIRLTIKFSSTSQSTLFTHFTRIVLISLTHTLSLGILSYLAVSLPFQRSQFLLLCSAPPKSRQSTLQLFLSLSMVIDTVCT